MTAPLTGRIRAIRAQISVRSLYRDAKAEATITQIINDLHVSSFTASSTRPVS